MKGVGADRHVFGSVIPLVSALCSPVILISRSRELRGEVGYLLRRLGCVKKSDKEGGERERGRLLVQLLRAGRVNTTLIRPL